MFQLLIETGLAQSIALACEPFNAVAVYGMVEAALGDSDEDLCRIVHGRRTRREQVADAEGIDHLAAPVGKEVFDATLMAKSFRLGEREGGARHRSED